ncbi:Hsp20/alpha crystallin family protein [Synechococcus sp. RSCCF101]|uniref:Hsp20/alpha crystallin family protein n=1 Tax=Synechococcus sp. RSCCF101 TaxID=2511069 RepID=UPI0012456F7E|nr:Hsp20/alpha crystallin family protein [Synechococcus sp. RSCCF101]QEY33016.1 Hsp20/alpha crystallin family protein [Synechococcus sp. RSCCF101]
MMSLRSTSPIAIFDRLEQQLQHQLQSAERLPAAELREDGERYELMLELPGVQRDAIDVQATDRSLVVSAERRNPSDTEAACEPGKGQAAGQDAVILSEFRYGTWGRSFRFPQAIQRDGISAIYRDGVLTVVAPKAQSVTSVAVQVAG